MSTLLKHDLRRFHDAFRCLERFPLRLAPQAGLVAASHCLAWRNLLWVFQEPAPPNAQITTVITVDTLNPKETAIRSWPQAFISGPIRSAGINFRGFWILTTDLRQYGQRAFFPKTLNPKTLYPNDQSLYVDFQAIRQRLITARNNTYNFEEGFATESPQSPPPKVHPSRVFLSPPEFDSHIHKPPLHRRTRLRTPSDLQEQSHIDSQPPTFEDCLGFVWSYHGPDHGPEHGHGHELHKQPAHLTSGRIAHTEYPLQDHIPK